MWVDWYRKYNSVDVHTDRKQLINNRRWFFFFFFKWKKLLMSGYNPSLLWFHHVSFLWVCFISSFYFRATSQVCSHWKRKNTSSWIWSDPGSDRCGRTSSKHEGMVPSADAGRGLDSQRKSIQEKITIVARPTSPWWRRNDLLKVWPAERSERIWLGVRGKVSHDAQLHPDKKTTEKRLISISTDISYMNRSVDLGTHM